MALDVFVNTFAGNPLDRASERRGDPAWLAEQLGSSEALGLAFWKGRPLLEDAEGGGVRIAYLPGALIRDLAGGGDRTLFLGLWKAAPVFAVELVGPADPAEGALQGLGRFEELRPVAARLPAPETGILATARSMFEWLRRHDHCSACGQPSRIVDGGWKRRCPACETEHFPRTDPVAIMLPTFGERCMLGRQEAWPPGMFSALAGFLEPGESIEEGCARELFEEAGLRARRVRYHSSQPWPFPSQLMIGLVAEVDNDQAAPDQTELSEVRWFTRQEARDLLAGKVAGTMAPPPLAIAHQLIKAWAEEGFDP